MKPCSFTAEGGYGVITSGIRVMDNNCSSPFAWMPNPGVVIPFNFTDWVSGQPDCLTSSDGGYESCVIFYSQDSGNWIDYDCSATMCPLCQIDLVIPNGEYTAAVKKLRPHWSMVLVPMAHMVGYWA